MKTELCILFIINSILLSNCHNSKKLRRHHWHINKHCRATENMKCRYDPDQYLNVPQIIREHGYPSETHTLVTQDGYLLEVHRIPGNKNGKKGGQPVLLQHGLLGSSADWVMNKNSSLAFVLADRGYDIWLGNARGNTYSRGHVSLPEWSAQYWNFSWHEMGTRDLPTVLYHIGNITGKAGDIIYIGHSMGTTMFFVLSSTLPQVAKNVKLMVALAPVAYMTHIKSPIRYLAPFVYELEWIQRELGANMFLPSNKLLKLLAYECNKKYTKEICENVMFAIAGFDQGEFNIDILEAVVSHDPAGTSTKTVLHYAQEIKNSGKFQNYDYGLNGNMIQYGRPTPPEYKLSNINRPIAMIYAVNDQLASSIDVIRLSKNISSLVETYKVSMINFNHIDFLFGKDVFKLVYKHVLDVMQNFTIT